MRESCMPGSVGVGGERSPSATQPHRSLFVTPAHQKRPETDTMPPPGKSVSEGVMAAER